MTRTLDRRHFVKGMAGLGAGLAVGRVAAQNTATRPNILLIVAEDMGPTLSCYGDPQVRTPHLDRLAAQGVRFERAFVTQASCSPSRSSILTGLYPHQNGQLGLSHYGFRMPDGLPNLPSELKKADYRTGIVGKLHVNPAKDFPFDFKGVGHGKTRDVRAPAASFRQFLQDGGAKPFFFYLNFADAHTPFSAQVAGVPEHPTKPDDVKPWDFLGIDSPELRQRVAGYYNSVRRVDEGIGQLMKVLDNPGRALQAHPQPARRQAQGALWRSGWMPRRQTVPNRCLQGFCCTAGIRHVSGMRPRRAVRPGT
ncbi:MAG: sulfatase-like hydrolase/transferase [Lentisphaeria bacterium]|nr:sulfatase-like hydrolase/transferase [Lentisphaeria bacterium]